MSLAALLDSRTVADASAGSREPRLVVTVGNASRINATAYSADGSLIATAGDDGATSVRDVRTGLEVRRFVTAGGMHYVAFAADTSSVFAGGEGGGDVWDLQRGVRTRHIDGRFDVSHGGIEGAFAFAPRSRYAFSNAQNWEGVIWDTRTGRALHHLPLTADHVTAAAFSPDETSLLISTASGSLQKWTVADARRLWQIRDPGAVVFSVAFSADGKRFITSAIRPSVRDASNGSLLRRFDADGVLVLGVALSRDGQYALAASWGRAAWLWNVGSGARIYRIPHVEPVATVAFAPQGDTFVTGSWDGTLRLWDRMTGSRLPRFDSTINDVREVGFRSGAPYIVAASQDRIALLWDSLTTGDLRRFAGHRDAITSAALSPNGQKLVTGSGDLTASLWDVQTGNESARLEPHGQYVMDPSFSADGSAVATAGGKGSVWDSVTSERRMSIGGDDFLSTVFRIALSPDGTRLVTAGVPGFSHESAISEAVSGKKLGTVAGQMRSWAFVPNTHGLVVAGEDRSLDLIDTNTVKVVAHLGKQRQPVAAMSVTPDGTALVTADEAGTIKIWDIHRRSVVSTFGSGSAVSSIAIAADRKMVLAATTPDHFVHVWDVSAAPVDLARVATFRDGTWVAVGNDGRFDTNNLEQINGLGWVFPNAVTSPLPVEVFMRQYYEPQLIQRLLRHARFRPIGSLATLDRTQPRIAIAAVQPATRPDALFIEVAIPNAAQAGARDLRLFRDGTLAGRVAGAIGSRVRLGPIDLPHSPKGSAVRFSAYAFNRSGVKSATASKVYVLSSTLPARKPRVYLVAFGVSANEHSAWKLAFADSDAIEVTRSLGSLIRGRKDYEFVPVSLTSRSATSANLHGILQRLAGGRPSDGVDAAVPAAAGLRKVQPEDHVIIFYSGHGYTGDDGTFYFVPFDTGSAPIESPETRGRFLSTDIVSSWLADINPATMTLVIDACESAETVQAYGFRAGPFGSRGLGQLAYDKGMRILAASQADSVAIEAGALRQGLLTYALVNDGLLQQQADRDPHDGSITLRKLLRYAVGRVPALDLELQLGGVRRFDPVAKEVRPVISLSTPESVPLQQPVLFDFARSANDFSLVGPDEPPEPAPGFYAFAESPDAKSENLAYQSAFAASGEAAIVALRRALSLYPGSRHQTGARLQLLGAMISQKAPARNIVAECRELVAFLRDDRPDALKIRYAALLGTANSLQQRGESLEDALRFTEDAELLRSRFGGTVDPDLETLKTALIRDVALKARVESRPLKTTVLQTLLGRSEQGQTSASSVSVLLYGGSVSPEGARLINAFGETQKALQARTGITWRTFVPADTPTRISTGDALNAYASPTIFLIDGSGTVRYRDSIFSPNTGTILRTQIDTLTKEHSNA